MDLFKNAGDYTRRAFVEDTLVNWLVYTALYYICFR